MPRQARLDYPGCLHHVINRGIERRAIFHDAEDYKYFTETLGSLITDYHFICYGWVLMPNHFHLLLETGPIPVSKLMLRLLTGYAGYFNRKHRRAGHLFQNRYKSIVCDKDSYVTELVAYIHLNPLHDSRILGGGDFVRFALKRIESKSDDDSKLKKMDFAELLQKVSTLKGVGIDSLKKPGKTTKLGTECRAMLAYLGVRHCAKTITSIAEEFKISPPAGSALYRRGEKMVGGDSKLRKMLLAYN